MDNAAGQATAGDGLKKCAGANNLGGETEGRCEARRTYERSETVSRDGAMETVQ